METKNAIKILKNGGVGILATDTIYGVVGSAFSKKTVERIYKVKGRDAKKPFIVLISSINDLKNFGISHDLIRANRRTLEDMWPGKVSIVLPCDSKKFEYLHRGQKSIAFRFPASAGGPAKKALIEIIKKTGPLVAPSANPSGLPPAENIAEAKKYFKDSVDFYIAGGTKKGKPSKVVSLVSGSPVVLRR